jgi:hypothetical protein
MSLGISIDLHSINIFFVSADALTISVSEKLTREIFQICMKEMIALARSR